MLKLPWLRLGEAVERLASRGLSAEDAKGQLTRAIASQQALKVRLPECPPIPKSSGFGWLATPELDFGGSTIAAPCKGSDPREPTRRRAVIIEVRAEDVDRLWPDPIGASPLPTLSKPPANDNPSAAVRTIANEKAEKESIDWLRNYVAEGGERLTKTEAFSLVKEQPWGEKLSETGFNARVWPAAVPADWRTGGRPKKPPG